MHDEPTVTLLDAMRLAQDRDGIARQYATAYVDVRRVGAPALGRAIRRGACLDDAVLHCQLLLMANLPVFDDAGLLQIDCAFSDIEDFQSYAAPVYQALCNFSCLAPSAVESTDPAIRDVVTHLIYEATNG